MPDTPKPTIDQRLDRLVERHEALSESVEMLMRTQHESVEMFVRAQHESVEMFVRAQHASEQAIAKLSENVGKMADSIATLGRIAGLHEQRHDETDRSIDALIARLKRIERRARNEE
jgi:hypothetical protein